VLRDNVREVCRLASGTTIAESSCGVILMLVLPASFFVLAVFLGSASAGTINLTGGSIDYADLLLTPIAPVHFVGDRGFTFDGRATGDIPTFGGGCPSLPPAGGGKNCLPGQTMSLNARAGTSDLPGEATLDGISYPDVGVDINALDTMEFIITGETITPPFGASSTETLVVPVSFTGTFNHTTPPSIAGREILVGNAIATVTLTRSNNSASGEPFWVIHAVNYDIVAISSNVVIDIKPKTINAKSHGKISVAILSSETFDATTIDEQTLRFGETGQEQSLAKCKKNAKDPNSDGLADLVCSFETEATGLKAGDTTGVLTGTTLDGTSFRGTDSIQVR
jgi:hypothetical protein